MASEDAEGLHRNPSQEPHRFPPEGPDGCAVDEILGWLASAVKSRSRRERRERAYAEGPGDALDVCRGGINCVDEQETRGRRSRKALPHRRAHRPIHGSQPARPYCEPAPVPLAFGTTK
jgi:hypothetical protein